ncbi:hypothetical protein [Streptomyces sp. NPDC018833]|uniref:hypothetical protein n=1 Tax=Streptomyces sp. NPDC018833 TaxID=3365053 RepID=UPI00378A6112
MGEPWAPNVVADRNLVTGHNPSPSAPLAVEILKKAGLTMVSDRLEEALDSTASARRRAHRTVWSRPRPPTSASPWPPALEAVPDGERLLETAPQALRAGLLVCGPCAR